jgi:uncharacterized membrane protein YidH (DUF202 family)
MPKIVAWSLFALGVIHIVFGIVRFKVPLAEAVFAGFVGKFKEPEVRRTAFWFLMCGPLLMLVGHIAVRAVANGDHSQLKLIGMYTFIWSVIGVAAFPKSPLWALLLLSPLLVASGYGLFP